MNAEDAYDWEVSPFQAKDPIEFCRQLACGETELTQAAGNSILFVRTKSHPIFDLLWLMMRNTWESALCVL